MFTRSKFCDMMKDQIAKELHPVTQDQAPMRMIAQEAEPRDRPIQDIVASVRQLVNDGGASKQLAMDLLKLCEHAWAYECVLERRKEINGHG